MKKIIIALTALLAFVACSKTIEDIQKPSQENTPIHFNLSVDQMNTEATKAPLKGGWADGDVVYVFFDQIGTKYIKKSFDGSTWTDTFPGGAFNAEDFSAEGPAASRNMTAVWFPQGEVTVTYADSKFSFTIGGEKIYSHYMSVHAAYTLSENTITGTLNMEKPAGFVQYFVPGIAAADAPTYRLIEPRLTPIACHYVALSGGVTESALTAGYSLKGMAFTSDASVTGALFGGRQSKPSGLIPIYVFYLVKEYSIEKPASVGTYILSGTRTIQAGTSVTFPTLASGTWGDMIPFVYLGYDGGPRWATGNLKDSAPYIAGPFEAGNYYEWGHINPHSAEDKEYSDGYNLTTTDPAYAKNHAWRMPSIAEFSDLISNTNASDAAVYRAECWKEGWTSLGSGFRGGALLRSKANGISIFLPAAGHHGKEDVGNGGCYWSTTTGRLSDWSYYLNFGHIEVQTWNDTRNFNAISVRPVRDNLQ